MILAVVASPAAHHRGVSAKSIATVPHAVAWRVAFGTKAVGFLNSAVYGLRAIENPARAVALLTQMIAVQASRPPLRNLLKPDAGSHVLETSLWSGSLGDIVTSSTDTPLTRFCGHGPRGAGLVAHLEGLSLSWHPYYSNL